MLLGDEVTVHSLETGILCAKGEAGLEEDEKLILSSSWSRI
jgi:hypothetical protein